MPRKTKLGLRAQGFELLGIEEADVLTVPKIEPMLRRAGVLDKVWDYLETSGDDMARHLIAQKYKLQNKSQRTALPFEAFCVAAGLDTKKVLGLLFAEVFTQNQQLAEVMAAAAQPDVVQATIDRAVEPGGSRERDMLHKHSRFTPVPQTSVTFVRNAEKVFGGDDRSQNVALLPPIETTVRQISDRFNERLLGAPAESPVVEAEFEEEEGDEEDETTV